MILVPNLEIPQKRWRNLLDKRHQNGYYSKALVRQTSL